MWKNKATALFNSLRKEKEKKVGKYGEEIMSEIQKKKVQFAACQIVLESMLTFYTKIRNYSAFFFLNCAPNKKRGRWKKTEREREGSKKVMQSRATKKKKKEHLFLR